MKQVLTKIDSLKQEHTLPQTIKTLSSLVNNFSSIVSSNNLNFQLVTTLITHTIPQLYISNPEASDTQLNSLIEKLGSSLTGLNQISNWMSTLSKTGDKNLSEKAVSLVTKIVFTGSENTLYDFLTQMELVRLPQLKAGVSSLEILFFRSKLFSQVSELNEEFGLEKSVSVSLEPWLNFKIYSEWLSSHYVVLLTKCESSIVKRLNKCTFAVLKNNTKLLNLILFECLSQNNEHTLFKKFKQHFSELTKLEKVQFVRTHLMGFLATTVSKNLTRKNYNELLYLVTFYLNQFEFSTIDYSAVVLDWFKSFSKYPKPVAVFFLHSFVLALKCDANEPQFLSGFKSWIEKYWASELFIRNCSIESHSALTIFLLTYLYYMEPMESTGPFLSSLTGEAPLINSTTHHLDSPMIKVRHMGIIFAEKLSSLSDKESPLDFKMASSKQYASELTAVYEDLSLQKACSLYIDNNFNSYDYIQFIITSLSEHTHNNASQASTALLKETAADTLTLVNRTQNLQITADPDSESDSDDEDYEDATLVKQNNTIPSKPLYLRDLNSYLIAQSKEDPHQAYLKKKVGLESFSKLVRSKKSMTKDLDFWCKDLCSSILNLKTDDLVSSGKKSSFDHQGVEQAIEEKEEEEDAQIQHVNHLKLTALITLNVVNPDVAPKYLVEQLLAGDFSMVERLIIINSLGLSARELKGFKDEINIPNLKVEAGLKLVGGKVFPSKQLPSDLHQKFLMIDDNFAPEKELKKSKTQTQRMLEAESKRIDGVKYSIDKSINENNKELITNEMLNKDNGKVLRISSRLLKEREKKNEIPPVKDQYSEKCYENFIQPLLAAWFSLDGEIHSLGPYSNIIITALLKNINVLVYCSYPRSIHTIEIVRDVFNVVDGLKHIIANVFDKYDPAQGVTIAQIAEIFECQLYLLLTIVQLTSSTVLKAHFQAQLSTSSTWLNYYFANFDNLFGNFEVMNNVKSLIANCLLQINNAVG